MSAPKKPYCRIDFTNCSIEFDWTICPFSEVIPYIESIQDDFKMATEGEMPEVKISIEWMTDAVYNKCFDKYIEP